ncbi:MAG: response regulator [Nitrospirae bacterium]|nr:response regulator [Nitrospirota bacterium]MCL5063129.1 response regulator [Nitrospirota bacterium]MDA8338181.1 response regulator [Nitrospiraceae bacterium]
MKKILVVDDEPDVAELMRFFLDSLGYKTDIFLSCEESMEAVLNNKYWAVFCDYMMPYATGDNLYYRIRETNSELAERFIMITGAVLNEKLDEFVKKEGIRVINKPFKLEEIKNILVEFEKAER